MNSEEKALKLIEDSMNKKCNGLECKVVKNNIDLRLENIHLNRQVDLMAEHLIGMIFFDKKNGEILFDKKEDIKQYFKEIAEENSSIN